MARAVCFVALVFFRHGHPSWKRRHLLSMMSTVLVSLYTFLFLHITVTNTLTGHQHSMTSSSEERQLPLHFNDSRLIDRNDFRYVLQPVDICSTAWPPNDIDRGNSTYFIIFVHSAPNHFKARENIRSTWGSLKSVDNWGVRVIFLLGQPMDNLQLQLEAENEEHGDIVQGNFVDSYRNLSYKHMMGYKWILSNCPQAQFIVKADDDAFVDVIQLYYLLHEMYNMDWSKETSFLACSVWPSGSPPQRQSYSKWAVTVDEYPDEFYPAYCGGLAYVVSPWAAKDLLAASLYVPLFWIDDIYVTGLLAQTVPGLRHHSLNLRTTYDWQALLQWLREPLHRARPSPYIFGDVSGSVNRTSLMQQLWAKTKSVWNSIKVTYKKR